MNAPGNRANSPSDTPSLAMSLVNIGVMLASVPLGLIVAGAIIVGGLKLLGVGSGGSIGNLFTVPADTAHAARQMSAQQIQAREAARQARKQFEANPSVAGAGKMLGSAANAVKEDISWVVTPKKDENGQAAVDALRRDRSESVVHDPPTEQTASREAAAGRPNTPAAPGTSPEQLTGAAGAAAAGQQSEKQASDKGGTAIDHGDVMRQALRRLRKNPDSLLERHDACEVLLRSGPSAAPDILAALEEMGPEGETVRRALLAECSQIFAELALSRQMQKQPPPLVATPGHWADGPEGSRQVQPPDVRPFKPAKTPLPRGLDVIKSPPLLPLTPQQQEQQSRLTALNNALATPDHWRTYRSALNAASQAWNKLSETAAPYGVTIQQKAFDPRSYPPDAMLNIVSPPGLTLKERDAAYGSYMECNRMLRNAALAAWTLHGNLQARKQSEKWPDDAPLAACEEQIKESWNSTFRTRSRLPAEK